MKTLEERVEELENILAQLTSANTIPVWLDQALQGAGYVKQTSVTKNKVLTYYVGTVQNSNTPHQIVITNGVLTIT